MVTDFDAHLCDVCILRDSCPVVEFPVWDCGDFDDGYEGPEYPDGGGKELWQLDRFTHYQ